MKTHSEPKDKLLRLAIKILDSFLDMYGSESAYLATEGDILTQEETEYQIQNYLTQSGFSDLINIRFSET